MCEKKGLKIVVTFRKVQTSSNEPRISAMVKLDEVEGLDSKAAVMKVMTGEQYWSQTKEFPTAVEAETWAKGLAEQIKSEYMSMIARVDALEVPADFTVEA